jgi:hypothetical protein
MMPKMVGNFPIEVQFKCYTTESVCEKQQTSSE